MGWGTAPRAQRREHAFDEPDGVGQADGHRRSLFHAMAGEHGGQAVDSFHELGPGQGLIPTGEGGSVRIDLGQLSHPGNKVVRHR